MKKVSPNELFVFPRDVARCPVCGERVCAYFDEWDTKTGKPTEGGFHLDCMGEPDESDWRYPDFIEEHWGDPYVWEPLKVELYAWFTKRYALDVVP